MATGKLKMWNADRGFGFISDDSGGPDVFLHATAL
jgi:CspA family cold shock protein